MFDNIEAYGGDPQNVYLVGQSAGAHLSSLVLLLQAQREAAYGEWTVRVEEMGRGMTGRGRETGRERGRERKTETETEREKHAVY